MTCLPATLLTGALDHLLRYTLKGCDQSARHAAYLLGRLLNQEGVGEELRDLCQRLSEILENEPAPKSRQLITRNVAGEPSSSPCSQTS